MCCKYCDLVIHKIDDDAEAVMGEDWEKEHGGDGGYIYPDEEGANMMVYYDGRCASTAIHGIEYCPFCGAEIEIPPEPLVKDIYTRKLVVLWAETLDIDEVRYLENDIRATLFGTPFGSHIDYKLDLPTRLGLDERMVYSIEELVGDYGDDPGPGAE